MQPLASDANGKIFVIHFDIALMRKHFDCAAHYFSRATHNQVNFLAGDANLHAVWMSERTRPIDQLLRGASDTATNVQKCQVARLMICRIKMLKKLIRQNKQKCGMRHTHFHKSLP